MTLPLPKARVDLHTRTVTFQGYLRDDKLWDIEANLTDVKPYPLKTQGRGLLQPGSPIHDMAIRVTLDDTMTVREIVTSMSFTPFPECVAAEDPMQKMIGCTIGPGWRSSIEKNLGGVKGCTHLRELLFNMATAAYQTIAPYRDHFQSTSGRSDMASDSPPYHLGKCMSWDFNSEVVKRHEPDFYGWKPLNKIEAPNK